jgi:hypothetical protein
VRRAARWSSHTNGEHSKCEGAEEVEGVAAPSCMVMPPPRSGGTHMRRRKACSFGRSTAVEGQGVPQKRERLCREAGDGQPVSDSVDGWEL